jgi:hypothetical protein
MILTLLIGLTSGCAQTTSGDYCDIASPILFADKDVVKYLSQNDTILLREIVIHNETQAKLCGG